MHKILELPLNLNITACHFGVQHTGLKTIIMSETRVVTKLCYWAGSGAWPDFLLPHFPHLHPAISYCYKKMNFQTSWCFKIRMNTSVENWLIFFLVEMYNTYGEMKLRCVCQARMRRQFLPRAQIPSLWWAKLSAIWKGGLRLAKHDTKCSWFSHISERILKTEHFFSS